MASCPGSRLTGELYNTWHSNSSLSHCFLLRHVSAQALPLLSTMAAFYPSPRGLPTPSSSVGRRPTAPAAPKLRESCQVCASSKLKCSKEKPTCSRCAKRGLICEYVTAKRGGRRHDDRSSINGSDEISHNSTATSTIMQKSLHLTSISAARKHHTGKQGIFVSLRRLRVSHIAPMGYRKFIHWGVMEAKK